MISSDLVEPDVGGLLGLVEDIEAGGLMSNLPHDRTAALLEERTGDMRSSRALILLFSRCRNFRRRAQSAQKFLQACPRWMADQRPADRAIVACRKACRKIIGTNYSGIGTVHSVLEQVIRRQLWTRVFVSTVCQRVFLGSLDRVSEELT